MALRHPPLSAAVALAAGDDQGATEVLGLALGSGDEGRRLAEIVAPSLRRAVMVVLNDRAVVRVIDLRRPASELRLADVVRFIRDDLPPAVQEAIAALSRERLAAVLDGLRLAA